MAKEIRRHAPPDEMPGEFFDPWEIDFCSYISDQDPSMDQIQIFKERLFVWETSRSMILDLSDKATDPA